MNDVDVETGACICTRGVGHVRGSWDECLYHPTNLAKGWEIRQGDALDVLRTLPAASVGAVVTDPPYGERAATWDGPRPADWYERWMAEAHRVLRPNAPLVTFGSRRYLDVIMGALRRTRGDTSECPLQSGVWVHGQGFPPRAGYLRPEHEPFVVSGLLRTEAEDVRRCRPYGTDWNAKGPVRRNVAEENVDKFGFGPTTFVANVHGPMGGTVVDAPRNLGRERVDHPTQKPETVMAYLVCLGSDPGDLVLDPFAGSGTVGVVALRHGRRFLGIERNPTYCAMARRRIAGPLFAEASA